MFGPKFRLFLRNYASRQIRGCWFQIWQFFLKILAQKYSNKPIFGLNFTVRQFQGRWFQIWQWLFWIPTGKYPKKQIFVLNVSIVYFGLKLRMLKLISKMASFFFQIPAINTQIQNFLWKLNNFFILSQTLSELNFI